METTSQDDDMILSPVFCMGVGIIIIVIIIVLIFFLPCPLVFG
jgi:hypothetical protein